jgi:hypothetical protein
MHKENSREKRHVLYVMEALHRSAHGAMHYQVIFRDSVGTISGLSSEKARQKLRKMTHIHKMQYPTEFDLFIPTRRLGSTESGIPCGKEQRLVFVTSFDRGFSEDHRGTPLLLSTARSSY